MKLRYLGPRESVSIVCSGRVPYYFERDEVTEVGSQHITELLRSVRNRFEVVIEEPKAVKPEAPKAEAKDRKPRRRRKKEK